MQAIKRKRPNLPRGEFNRRADKFLAAIQKDLLPEHSQEFVAINMETGEYVLAATSEKASDEFERRWPDVLSFQCRVDGGPVDTFHGK